jgi:hypothetical protein
MTSPSTAASVASDDAAYQVNEVVVGGIVDDGAVHRASWLAELSGELSVRGPDESRDLPEDGAPGAATPLSSSERQGVTLKP